MDDISRHRAEIDDDCGRCGGKLGVDNAVERRVRNVAHEIAAAEPAPERAEAFRSVDDGDARSAGGGRRWNADARTADD